MLNYIWLGLILAGILAALTTDIGDLVTDRFRNDRPIEILLYMPDGKSPESGMEAEGRILIERVKLNEFYGTDEPGDSLLKFDCSLKFSSEVTGVVRVPIRENYPSVWYILAESHSDDGRELTGSIVITGESESGIYRCLLTPDPVRFAVLRRVTNEGIVSYASTAVAIALGLIGIMALWLGVMKVAEEAGIVRAIASGLRPVMTRLFPDVPADHPAMGAMILNIAANMLGLANAATPLGLKAMEELNKLNKKIGTATDAMCTFLVINTSSVQLIPATVIAIRVSAGSSNPVEIIAPMIIATFAATVSGVVVVKLLQRLPVYRRQIETGEEA